MIARDVVRVSVREVLASVTREVAEDIPVNAIYANGDPIPDPSGTGYLRYGASV